MKKPLFKPIHWPKRLVPDEESYKLQGEFHDDVDTFAGHHDYRPDCITRSGTFCGVLCCRQGTFDTDPQWWIDQYAYAMPGDYSEDAGV